MRPENGSGGEAQLPDVSVIIVSWNTRDLLDACLASVFCYTHRVSLEVWVVDNGSSDGTPAVVRAKYPSVNLLEPGVNLGFARANNLALRASLGRHVLFLNPDTELHSDVVSAFCERLDRDQSIGLIGCLLTGRDGKPQLTCAATFPSPWNNLCHGLFLHRLAGRFPGLWFFSSRSLEHWDHRTPGEVDSISGAFMFCRGELVRKLGGFDEGYFMYGEDLDLCFRVRQSGFRIRYDPSHRVTHYGGASSSIRSDFLPRKEQYRANLMLLQKHWGKARAQAFRLTSLLVTLVRLLAAGVIYLVLPSRRATARYHWKVNRALWRELTALSAAEPE